MLSYSVLRLLSASRFKYCQKLARELEVACIYVGNTLHCSPYALYLRCLFARMPLAVLSPWRPDRNFSGSPSAKRPRAPSELPPLALVDQP